MSWATLWAKARENHARSSVMRWRARSFVIGAIFAGTGAYNLYSDAVHQIHGMPATATLMAHLKLCTVEYRRIGEQERRDQLPCELAEEFQRRAGSNKVKLSRDYVAHVRFKLEDGRLQEANVDDIKLGSYRLAVGATLPVIYAADNPADVRAGMSWQTLKVPLILLAVGLPFLALSFGAPLVAVFRWAFRRREEETVSAPAAPSRSADVYLPRTGSVPVPRTSFGMRNR